MLRIEPELPILRIEPALPILRIDPALPMLSKEPALPILNIEPMLPILRMLSALLILHLLGQLSLPSLGFIRYSLRVLRSPDSLLGSIVIALSHRGSIIIETAQLPVLINPPPTFLPQQPRRDHPPQQRAGAIL